MGTGTRVSGEVDMAGGARQKRAEADAARQRRDCRCCRLQVHVRRRVGEISQVMQKARTKKDSKEVVLRDGVSVRCTFRLRCSAFCGDGSLLRWIKRERPHP